MFIILFATVLIIVFIYLKFCCYQYWDKLGVPGPKPLLLVGNLGDSYLLKKNPGLVVADIYKKYADLPLIGIYISTTPAVIIRDPGLIRDVLVKEFDSFQDNELYVDPHTDPLFGRNPFVTRGSYWKLLRSQLTPSFTTLKVKNLYPLLEEVARELVIFIGNQKGAFSGEGLDARNLCAKYTLNNVATCAFGIDGKCFENSKSEFEDIADGYLSPSGWSNAKLFLSRLIPPLSTFTIKIVPADVEDKIKDTVVSSMEYRKKNNLHRNDFLNDMIQLKEKSEEGTITDVDVAAHCASFFLDGYETSTIVMSYVLYYLGADIGRQATLRKEVDQAFGDNGNNLPYDILQNMTYLDAVLNESLRLSPALFTLTKICTKPFVYNPSGSKLKNPVTIEKNVTVIIPVYALHHDPKYFEDPDSFVPERFMGESRDNIDKFSFLPFSEGPRICLGRRFGVVQVKLGIAHVVRNYEISVNSKTKVPFRFSPTFVISLPMDGITIDFKKIR